MITSSEYPAYLSSLRYATKDHSQLHDIILDLFEPPNWFKESNFAKNILPINSPSSPNRSSFSFSIRLFVPLFTFAQLIRNFNLNNFTCRGSAPSEKVEGREKGRGGVATRNKKGLTNKTSDNESEIIFSAAISRTRERR
ncbi:hypothetical protein CEXT_732531 [Caerostris extrusa]|uniref:Uncharacterized protein n=1 Tax=Caerostris extrusa TaxID=172846 RepID=A0AAV4QWX4_CAEEX|nr:hypothetical protein CEXT_732531 [Caerostris extrusa]